MTGASAKATTFHSQSSVGCPNGDGIATTSVVTQAPNRER